MSQALFRWETVGCVLEGRHGLRRAEIESESNSMTEKALLTELSFFLHDEGETVSFGQNIGNAVQQVSKEGALQGAVIYLAGTLGAGKTTLTRGLLTGFGHRGSVKSPTYTLVEPYKLEGREVYHFDLYRLADPEELEYMGIRDYFADSSICIIEWPDKGAGILPLPDIAIELSPQNGGRQALLQAMSDRGKQLLTVLVTS